MKTNAYRNASRQVVADEDENTETQNQGKCHAFGCPLPGVFAETNGSTWFCACHDGIRGTEWHTVTTRVRNRIGAFDACFKVMTSRPILSNWVPRAQAFIERHGIEHLVENRTRHDGQPFSAKKFFMMLHMALVAECRKDLLSKTEITVGKSAQAGLIDIKELIG